MRKTKSNRQLLFNSVFSVVIALIALDAKLLNQSGMKAQQVRHGGPIPYTATLRETVYAPNGQASVAMIETFAIRSDGSYVKILKHQKKVGDKLVDADSGRMIYFASGIRVEINDLAGSKSTTMFKENPAKFQRDPESKCLNTFDGRPSSLQEAIKGEEDIAGYKTVKIASGSWLNWYALEHGCALIKTRIDWSDQEYSQKDLVKFTPGEPDASLFKAPPDDQEMPPSERAMGRGKDAGSCGSQRCAEIFRKLDEEYKANRPKN